MHRASIDLANENKKWSAVKHECAEGLLNQTNYLSTSLHGPLFIGPIMLLGICVCSSEKKSISRFKLPSRSNNFDPVAWHSYTHT